MQRGEVDPTQVTLEGDITLLTAIDDSPNHISLLTKTAEIARRSSAQVIVLHIIENEQPSYLNDLKSKIKTLLADIDHQFLVIEGSPAEEIIKVAQEYQVSEILVGKKGHNQWEEILIGSVSQMVLENSLIPVILVE